MAKACKSYGTRVVAISCVFSGGRVSNAWVTHPGHRNNVGPRKGSFAKVALIPDDVFGGHLLKIKGWGPQGLPAWDRPISHQLVGKVTAYQGNDG